MNIMLLVPALNAGGVERGTIDLAISFQKQGHCVIVVSSGGTYVSLLKKHNIAHLERPIQKKSLLTLLQIKVLMRDIRAYHVDIVHAQSRVPAWIAYHACHKTGTPFVTSCHGFYSRQFFSRVMGFGKRVMVISRAIGDHMQQAFGVPQEKIRLVYRGLDVSRYPFQENKYNHTITVPRLLHIGRLTPIKGQKELLYVLAQLKVRFPNIRLSLVGPTGKKHTYKKQLHALVRALSLQDNVEFLGSRRDIVSLLDKADVLVLPTQIPEAFGRVLIEAGACGVAVCASRLGGIVEIIQDGEEGFLFNPSDIDDMAETITRALSDTKRLNSCRSRLREKVERLFTLDQMVTQTLSVYAEAIRRKRILFIKLGGLGDVILAIPSLRALRKKFPYAHIGVLVYRQFLSLIKDCPYVNEVITYSGNKIHILSLIRQIKKGEFDYAIDLKNNALTYFVVFLAGIPHRFGFARGFFSRLLTSSCSLPASDVIDPLAQQKNLLACLGIQSFDPALELCIDRRIYDEMKARLSKQGASEKDKIVGMVLQASQQWPTKNWPLDRLVALAQLLIAQGCKIVLIGQRYSRVAASSFPQDSSIIDCIGKTSTAELVALIRELDVLITPDSAPLHIAAAEKVNTIALFGPTDFRRHVPPSDTIHVFARQSVCEPCYHRDCRNKDTLICLRKVRVEEVFATVNKILVGRK